MIRPRPGSLPWLLLHELRLAFRPKSAAPWMWAFLIVGIPILHGVGFSAVWGLSKLKLAPEHVQMIFGGMGLFSAAVMLSAAMQLTVNSIYTRGDMDLLLSSPLRPSVILPIRLLAIALTVMSSSLILMSNFINPGAVMVSTRWLIGYVTIPALCLGVVTLSFLLVLGLVRLIGARRARSAAQVIAGVIGISVALAAQLPNLNAGAEKNTQLKSFQALGALADNPAMAPVRWLGAAVMGETIPLLALLTLSLGGFLLISLRLGPAFVRSLNEAAGTDMTARRKGAVDKGPLSLQIKSVTRTIIWKEWRLILRDPTLITQVAAILLVAAPIALPTARKSLDTASGEIIALAWLSVIPVCGLLAGALVWLAFAGEDAPDLLGTAPVASRRMLRDRLLAAAIPSIVLATVVCLVMADSAPLSAASLWLVCLFSTLLYLLLDMRQGPVNGGRKAFQKRYQSNIPALFGEMLLGFAVFGLAWLVLGVLAPVWALPLLLVLDAGALAALLLQKQGGDAKRY